MWPFSVLYHAITSLRNLAYDKGWFPVVQFDLPIIAIGNLSTGGTGKSPMVEYLIRLLSDNQKIGVLSRGYGRKSKGFVWGSAKSKADDIGDEPLQFIRKFSNIEVAVDGDRVHGVNKMLQDRPEIDCVLLDDAFQHRRIKAGFYILLSAYDELYKDDLLLPAGNLRESGNGARRADVVVITKCPSRLSEKKKNDIKKRLKLHPDQSLFFSHIQYDSHVRNTSQSIDLESIADYEILLVTGIAKPDYLVDHLVSSGFKVTHLEFGDHHLLSTSEHERIYRTFENLPGNRRLLLTTEKDFVRSFSDDENVFFIGIESVIDSSNEFNTIIEAYVRENKRNR